MPVLVGLVMDEDARGRHVLAEGLRRHGMQIVEAGSSAEAFALAQFGGVQFVVADADGASGLCGDLRASAATATLPVILLTGDARRPESARDVDGTVLMTRPVAAETVASTVARLLPAGAPLR